MRESLKSVVKDLLKEILNEISTGATSFTASRPSTSAATRDAKRTHDANISAQKIAKSDLTKKTKVADTKDAEKPVVVSGQHFSSGAIGQPAKYQVTFDVKGSRLTKFSNTQERLTRQQALGGGWVDNPNYTTWGREKSAADTDKANAETTHNAAKKATNTAKSDFDKAKSADQKQAAKDKPPVGGYYGGGAKSGGKGRASKGKGKGKKKKD